MAKNGSVDRRDFLKSAAVTGAALVGGAAGAEAQTAPPVPAAAAPASAPVAPRETDPSLEADIVTTDRPGCREAVIAGETGLPADDPVRFGADRLWPAVRDAVEALPWV